jgi:hypothetical protein
MCIINRMIRCRSFALRRDHLKPFFL